MIKVFILRALGIDCCDVMRKLAVVDGAAIHNGHDAVDCNFGRDAGPVERAHQGLWQGKTRRFDHDVIGFIFTRQQSFHRWDEIIGNGTADAAIGQLDNIVFGADFIAAAFQDVAIDPKIAKFIDDQRNPLALCVLQHVADERRFASAEKASDNCCGDLGGH